MGVHYLKRCSMKIELEEINEVSFSIRGPACMTAKILINEGQVEDIMSAWWEHDGDEFFMKYFSREGYTLTKNPEISKELNK